MHSRRELLVASAAVTAATLTGCGGGGKSQTVATVSTAQADSDAAILGALLDQENSSIAAYTLVASKLHGSASVSARRFLDHEHRHATALGTAVQALGTALPPARSRSEYEAGFPRLRNARDALSFALDVETTALAAYSDAIGKIATDGARGTAAAILVTESEHAAVVLGALGRPEIPAAFVNGPPPQP
jgi:hypothetical protein